MVYTFIEAPTDPNSIATDAEDRRAAQRAYGNDCEAVTDAVREYTEVVEDTAERYRLRAVVPFRVTALRHDFDDDRVAELQDEYGATPPGAPSDGWHDVESQTIRAIPIHQNVEFTPERLARHASAEQIEQRQAHEAIEAGVVKKLEDGEVETPLTVTVTERKETDPDVGMLPDDEQVPRDAFEESFELVDRPFRYGTARYRVDAIVTPETWDSNA